MDTSRNPGEEPPQGLIVPPESLHEIRNALSSIRIIHEVFRRTDTDPEGHDKLFVMLDRQMDQLEGLLENPPEPTVANDPGGTGE